MHMYKKYTSHIWKRKVKLMLVFSAKKYKHAGYSTYMLKASKKEWRQMNQKGSYRDCRKDWETRL